MNTLTNKLKKAAKHCNLLSNKILGKVAITAASLTTVGLIALTIHGFTQLPPFVQEQWERWGAGPNVAEMNRLAALPNEQLDQIRRRGYRNLSDEENLITWGIRLHKTGKYTGLTTAWRSMNPNRPLEASVKEEFIKSLGKTWRQQYGTTTCSYHVAEAIIRHKLTKGGAILPDWNAEDTARIAGNKDGAAIIQALDASMSHRRVNLKIRFNTATYAVRNRDIWVPVIMELIKQEIASGRPVAITSIVPGASFIKKHGNILKAPDEYEEHPPTLTPHALVVVGYKEREDGTFTEWEVWNPAGSPETHGIIQATDALLITTTSPQIYSIE